jgi:signal transduction histidine kinase/ActR/RegA family two-component response regulator
LPEEVRDKDATIEELEGRLRGLRSQLEKLGGEVVRADYKVLHLTQEVRRSREAFSFLTEFQNKISRARSLEKLYDIALKAIVSELWMKRAIVLERDRRSGVLRPVSYLGYTAESAPREFTLPAGSREICSRPQVVNSATDDAAWIEEVRTSLDVPFFTWVPSVRHGGIDNVLVAGNLVEDVAQQPKLEEPNLDIIESVGAILNVAQMNLLSRQRLKRQVRYQALLHRVSSLLMHDFDAPSTHFDEVLSRIGTEWGLDRARLLMRQPDGTTTSPSHEWAADGITCAGEGFTLDRVPRWSDAMTLGETVLIDDVETLPEAERDPLRTMGVRSLLVVPITLKASVIAWVSFEQCTDDRNWTSADVQLLELFGALISRAMAREREVEERAQLEAQYHHSKKMEAVGQLAGGIAHDFNNLLTTIQGYAQLLALRLPEEFREMPGLKEIVMASERAAALTRQLLSFSRRDTGKTGPVDVNTVISDTMKLVSRMLGEKVTVEFDLLSALPLILGDAQQLSQVIMNLAINARDAMPEGGKLTIRTQEFSVEGPLAKRFSMPGIERCQVIEVSDTGVGMDAETKERIFEPFFTTKDAGQGTGLGLSIVFSVVRRHGGFLEVSSQPGRGTMFSVFLPSREPYEEEESAERTLDETPAAHADETILIVEDDESVRTMISEVLESQGYNVVAVTNGREALEELKQGDDDISLIMTDIVMPEMNGLEMWDHLVQENYGMPVIVMSGYPQGEESKALLKGADTYLQKPFGPREITRAVRDTLDSVSRDGKPPTADGVH